MDELRSSDLYSSHTFGEVSIELSYTGAGKVITTWSRNFEFFSVFSYGWATAIKFDSSNTYREVSLNRSEEFQREKYQRLFQASGFSRLDLNWFSSRDNR